MMPEEQRALKALSTWKERKAAIGKYDPKKERIERKQAETFRKTEGDIRFHYGSLHMNSFTKWSALRRSEYKSSTFTAYYENLKPEHRADIKVEYINQ